MKNVKNTARMSAYAIAFAALALTGFNAQAMNKLEETTKNVFLQCKIAHDNQKTGQFSASPYTKPFLGSCKQLGHSWREYRRSGKNNVSTETLVDRLTVTAIYGAILPADMNIAVGFQNNDASMVEQGTFIRSEGENMLKILDAPIMTSSDIIDGYKQREAACEMVTQNSEIAKTLTRGTEFAQKCKPFFASMNQILKKENCSLTDYKAVPKLLTSLSKYKKFDEFMQMALLGRIVMESAHAQHARNNGDVQAAAVNEQNVRILENQYKNMNE
jgi:hypothetical protein